MKRLTAFFIFIAVLISSVPSFGFSAARDVAFHAPRTQGGCGAAVMLPLDAGVSGISAAYGTCSHTLKWNSRPLFDVVANNATFTIRAINGYPDVKTLARLMGNISPVAGIGGLGLSKWYDQSGNARDCTQATASHQMSVWLINGKVTIAADGSFYQYIKGSAQDRYCTMPSGVSVNSQASTFFVIGQPTNYGPPPATSELQNVMVLAGPGCCSGSAGAGFQALNAGGGGSNVSAAFIAFSWDGFSGPSIPQLWPEDQPVVLSSVFTASNVTYKQNEETAVTSASALVAQTSVGGSVGADSSQAGEGIYGHLQGVLIFGATSLSSGNQTTMRAALYRRFNIPSTQSYSIIVDGASYDQGQGSLIGGVQGYGWPEQVLAQIPYAVRSINIASSGATIANLTTAWSTESSYPCVGSYTKSILYGPGSAAGNSITGGETGAQAYTDLTTYLTTVKSKCTFDAILVGELNGGGENANYTALVIANAVSLGITPVPPDAFFSGLEWTNIVYFNQVSPYSIHPRINGYSFIAKGTLPYIRAAFGQ